MNKENLRLKTSEYVGNFLLENIHRSVYRTKNFEEARKHLKDGSVLFYFNHFAKLDAIVYTKIIREYLTSFDNLAAIASYRHMDPEKGLFNKFQSGLIKDWQEIFGPKIIPAIQEKNKPDYPNAEEFNRSAVKQAVRFLRKPGHILAISPEGTRSTNNELLPAQEGIETIFRLGRKNVLALPIAGIHSTIRPYNTKTQVFVGKMFSYEEIEKEREQNPEKSITDLMMRRLAQLLPETNRGYYR